MPSSKVLFFEETQGIHASGSHWLPPGEDSPAVLVEGYFDNDSVNNHWPRSRLKGAKVDVGSNWTAFESKFEGSDVFVDVICRLPGAVHNAYRGPLIVHDSNFFSAENFFGLDFGASSDVGLLAKGTTAISRVLPTNPISDLPTAVGELLTEGLPFSFRHGLGRGDGISPSTIAGEYLGYEFGIKPFISDMRAFQDATNRAYELLKQYAEGSGKLIRRRYEFPPDIEMVEHEFDPLGGFMNYLGGPAQSQVSGHLSPTFDGYPGVRTDAITRSRETWFSGAFTYHLPVGRSIRQKLLREEAEMRHLFGGLSVNTAWNLTPYSWAADWITNAGDVIHNIAAFAQDGLVMPWGYVMERCKLRVTSRVEGAYLGRMHPSFTYTFPNVVSTTYEAKFLRRRKATPFGFGLDEGGFTPRQKAITTALGITRLAS